MHIVCHEEVFIFEAATDYLIMKINYPRLILYFPDWATWYTTRLSEQKKNKTKQKNNPLTSMQAHKVKQSLIHDHTDELPPDHALS